MKGKIYRAFMAFLVFLLVLCMHAYADEKDDIKVKLDTGFDGVYKYGYSVPVSVEIQNNRGDINGELQIEVQNQGNNLTAYSTVVNIPKGSTKNYRMNVPFVSSGNINVKIFSGKETAYEDTLYPPTGSSREAYLIGILGDDFDSVNYFKSSKRINQSVRLTEDSFSESLDVMMMFDAIIIDNFDTSKLSKAQYAALQNWVHSGGLLIIGTGLSYSKTLSIFKDDFISGQFGDVKNISTNELNNYISKESQKPMEISVLDMDISNSTALLQDGGLPLMHLIKKGSGNILLSSFDFGMKPLSDWDNNGAFGTKIISDFALKDNLNRKYMESDYMLNNAVRIIPDLAAPGVKNFLAIFIIYALLVGPASYLILKRKDKREYMWLTVPALSMAFSGVMYVSGFGTRLNKPVANILSIINVSDTGTMNAESYAGIFIPIKSDIMVEAGEGMDVRPVVNTVNDVYVMPAGPGSTAARTVDAKVTTSAKTSIEFFKNGVWSMRMVRLERQGAPLGGQIESSLNYTDSAFTGTIKNQTGLDFDRCYLISPDQYVEIGPLKAGEIRNLKDIAMNYYNNQQGIMRFLDPYSNGNVRYNNMTDEEIKELKRKQLDYQLVNYYAMSNSYRIMDIKILAFTSTPISSDVLVNKKAVKRYDRSIVIADPEVQFNKGNKVEYPMGYLPPVSVSSTFNGYDPYGSMYYGRGAMEITFKAEDNILPEEIMIKYSMHSKSGATSNEVKQSLWNFKTGSWEDGSYNYFTITGEDIGKFVSKDGYVRIKIESFDDSFNMQPPNISLKGSVK